MQICTERGNITIDLITEADLGLDPNLGPYASADWVACSFEVEGAETVEATPEPGEFFVNIIAGKGADGSVTLSVEPVQ